MKQTDAGLAVKLAYSFGSVANAVKLRSIAMFLMIFYNQVLGLSPAVVSTIIMISMIFDAIFDPFVDQLSDNFRSRWGRRHPFMYLSAVPYPLFFFLLWNPPNWSEMALAGYLLVCLVCLRFVDTLFDLPTIALSPELAKSYDGRTQLSAMRAIVGGVASFGVSWLALNVFMKENPDGTGGMLAPDGYFAYSLAAALAIFASIMISSVGTHSFIPHLSRPEARKPGILQALKDLRDVVRDRSFIAAAIGHLLIAAAHGMAQSLEMYWNLYFFKLSQSQMVTITVVSMVASLTAALVATPIGGKLGKRNAAALLYSTWFLGTAIPVILVAAGVLTHPETIFYTVLVLHSMAMGSYTCAGIMIFVMLVDIVEQVQVRTGKRSEGVLLAADSFIKKVTNGFGVLIAGLILTVVAFPKKAERTQVPEATLDMMAIIFVPTGAVLVVGCLVAFSFYVLTRKLHEQNLATLGMAQPSGER